MTFRLTELLNSILRGGGSIGSPYVWKRKGITRATSGNSERRGHFGVDWNIYKIEHLSGSAKKVYAYLSRVADTKGYTFPFLRTIVLRTRLSKSTVGKALKELEEAALLEIQHRYSRRGGSSNLYRLRKVAEIYPQVSTAEAAIPNKVTGNVKTALAAPASQTQSELGKDNDDMTLPSATANAYVPEYKKQDSKAFSRVTLRFVLGFGSALGLLLVFFGNYSVKKDPAESKPPANAESGAKATNAQSRSTTISKTDLHSARDSARVKPSDKIGSSMTRREVTTTPDARAQRSQSEMEGVPVGAYKIIYSTPVFSEPRDDSDRVAFIDPGTKVNVIAVKGGWLEVRSKLGRPPGFIKKETALPWSDEIK